MGTARKDRYNPTERIGVNAVEQLILGWRWVYKETVHSDLGIDAIIEVQNEDRMNAKSIGLQIKTGDHHLHKGKLGLVHYTDHAHIDYWLQQSFPVLIISHLPESGKTYWQWVNSETVVRTVERWKIELPYDQELDLIAKDRLLDIIGDFHAIADFHAAEHAVIKSGESKSLVADAAEGDWDRYLIRSFRTVISDTNVDSDLETEPAAALDELVVKHRRLLITGAGGEGKSMALKRLALDLSVDSGAFIPIYKRFDNYVQQEIGDFLPPQWRNIRQDQLLLILDGLDEVEQAHFHEAVRKLRQFCQDNPDLRIVLSCRSNFFEVPEKPSAGLFPGFKIFGFVDLTREQVIGYANQSGVSGEEFFITAANAGFTELLVIPFFMRLLVDSFKERGQLQQGRDTLLDGFIEDSFRFDKDHFVTAIDLEFRKKEGKQLLQRIALVMEIAGKNHLSSDELQEIITRKDHELLKCSSIICRVTDSTNQWSFQHRNFQEYLAAAALRRRTWPEIQELMFTGSSKQMLKPTWANTLSFLMAISGWGARLECIDWMKTNDPFAMLRFEPGRVPETIRLEVLQAIFEDHKRKQIWFYSASIETKDLAGFCTFDGAFDFLLAELEDKANVLIVRLNALTILRQASLPTRDKTKVKPALVSILDEYPDDSNTIHMVLYGLKDILPDDHVLIASLVERYRNRRSQYIRAAMYRLLITANLVVDHIDFFMEGIAIAVSGVGEDRNSTSLSDEMTNLEAGFASIQDAKLLMCLIPTLADRLQGGGADAYRIKEILQVLVGNCATVYAREDAIYDVVRRLYLKVLYYGGKLSYESIPTFFLTTKTNMRFIQELLGDVNIERNVAIQGLPALLDDAGVEMLFLTYGLGKLTAEEMLFIEYKLRGYPVGHPGKKAAKDLFNHLKAGYPELNPVPVTGPSLAEKRQYSFELLFDAEAFRGEVLGVFQDKDLDQMTVREAIARHHISQTSGGLTPGTVYRFVGLAGQFDASEGLVALTGFLADEPACRTARMQLILEELEDERDRVLCEVQLEQIRDWCEEKIALAEEVRHDRHDGVDFVWYSANLLETIWRFLRRVSITLPVEDILNFTTRREAYRFHDDVFKIVSRLAPAEQIAARVEANLKSAIPLPGIWNWNARYAIDHAMHQIYPAILDRLTDPATELQARTDVLDYYVEKTKDLAALSELLDRLDRDPLRWNVINKLLALENSRRELVTPLKITMNNSEESPVDRLQAAKYLAILQNLDGIHFYLAELIKDWRAYQTSSKESRFLGEIRRVEALPQLLELLTLVKLGTGLNPDAYILEDAIVRSFHAMGTVSAGQLESLKTGLREYIKAAPPAIPDAKYLFVIIDQIEKEFILDHAEVISIENAVGVVDRLLGGTVV